MLWAVGPIGRLVPCLTFLITVSLLQRIDLWERHFFDSGWLVAAYNALRALLLLHVTVALITLGSSILSLERPGDSALARLVHRFFAGASAATPPPGWSAPT